MKDKQTTMSLKIDRQSNGQSDSLVRNKAVRLKDSQIGRQTETQRSADRHRHNITCDIVAQNSAGDDVAAGREQPLQVSWIDR